MKDDERCGMCAFSQETDKIEEVECHGDLPKAMAINQGGQLAFITVFPRMPALTGWCKYWEKGDMVRRSRILTGVFPRLDN
jgi:hypothetical protein